jgi:biotin carboxyl carrier protein
MTPQDRRDGAAAPRLPDPRGIRVRVLGAEGLDGLQPATVEPAPVPLEPAPRSAGLGPLGGVAVPAPATDPVADAQPALTIDGEPLELALTDLGGGRGSLRSTQAAQAADGGAPAREEGEPRHRVLIDEGPASPTGVARREVVVDGWRFEVELEPAARAALRERAQRGRDEAGRSGPTEVHAIIPGVVVSVSVNAGDEVAAGQQLLVVEAMKMQNELRAPRDGTIERVAVAPGATIEVGDLLLVLT